MFVIVILFIIVNNVAAELKIESVVMKPIRIGDFALNFDVSVSNLNSQTTYNFKVICEKCCVFLTGNETDCSSKMVGGSFGDIFPGKTTVVTIVWPTVVVFDRIGYCDIAVMATKSLTDKIRLAWRIEFNTTYDQHSKSNMIFNYIPKTANISTCLTPDLDPLDRCSPINCEAKYMGKRNFYNITIQSCLPVPECNHATEETYDYLQNECIVLSDILTESDLVRLRSGEFDEYDWEPSSAISPFLNSYNSPMEEAEEEFLKKSKQITQYSLYFTVVNCAVAIFISITVYCVVAIMISNALRRNARRKVIKEVL